jgi:hypothetical protein
MAGYRGLSDLKPVVGLDPADRLRAWWRFDPVGNEEPPSEHGFGQ